MDIGEYQTLTAGDLRFEIQRKEEKQPNNERRGANSSYFRPSFNTANAFDCTLKKSKSQPSK